MLLFSKWVSVPSPHKDGESDSLGTTDQKGLGAPSLTPMALEGAQGLPPAPAVCPVLTPLSFGGWSSPPGSGLFPAREFEVYGFPTAVLLHWHLDIWLASGLISYVYTLFMYEHVFLSICTPTCMHTPCTR